MPGGEPHSYRDRNGNDLEGVPWVAHFAQPDRPGELIALTHGEAEIRWTTDAGARYTFERPADLYPTDPPDQDPRKEPA